MAVASQQLQWQRVGLSITGASHLGAGLPIQDSMRGLPEGRDPAPVSALVLADGHGDKLHFRSAIGAQTATRLLTDSLTHVAKKLCRTRVTTSLVDALSKKLAVGLQREWLERVTLHARCEPFPQRCIGKLGTDERKRLKDSPEVAYGTTFLSAALTEQWGLLLRLGDGVVAVCDEAGNVTLPFAEQEKSSQKTESLCSPNAASKVQAHLLDFSESQPPAFVALSTDGYPDAVGGIERFVERVEIFSGMLRREGTRRFEASMRKHLNEVAPNLVDDTTVGLLVRNDFPAKGAMHHG